MGAPYNSLYISSLFGENFTQDFFYIREKAAAGLPAGRQNEIK